MITVHSSIDRIEAHIVRGLLESEGIPAWVLDDGLTRMNWLYAQAIGGCRVVVPAACVHDARALLDQHDAGALDLGLTDLSPVAWPHWGRLSAWVTWLAVGFPLPMGRLRPAGPASG